MANQPNLFSQAITTASSGVRQTFGFDASFVRIRNRSAVAISIALGSTSGATTSDYQLESSDELVISGGPRLSGVSILSTGVAAVNVIALGG